MANPQHINFRSVDALLDYLPESERELMLYLRQRIDQYVPTFREKLAYNVPFYYGQRRTCYLWPASIPWGRVHKGVVLGFTQGYRFQDPFGYLERLDRKTTTTWSISHLSNIDEEAIAYYLLEAHRLDMEGDRA